MDRWAVVTRTACGEWKTKTFDTQTQAKAHLFSLRGTYAAGFCAPVDSIRNYKARSNTPISVSPVRAPVPSAKPDPIASARTLLDAFDKAIVLGVSLDDVIPRWAAAHS